jgi:carbamoyl-phosphate synthase large subunit
MPKDREVKKVLVIGSGPVIIGQGSEYDYAGIQACKALRSLGCQCVVVHSDPAAVMTDKEMAERTYVESLEPNTVADIIRIEQPDALLPCVGGQAALNLALDLLESGVLDENSVNLMGIQPAALSVGVERRAFEDLARHLHIERPTSHWFSDSADAARIAEQLAYPVVIRPASARDGLSKSLVYNVEELQVAAKNCLAANRRHEVLVEQALLNWQELEVVIVRDAAQQKVSLGWIENVDPMGIHHGDSLCVTPTQTLDSAFLKRLEAMVLKVADALALQGEASVRLAIAPETQKAVLISVAPRATRASVLVSLATGIPVSRVATLLASGMNMTELAAYPLQGEPDGILRPDHVMVRFPRWAFDSFDEVQDRIGIRMRSVGASIGSGRSYKEALQKAVRSQASECCGFDHPAGSPPLGVETLISQLALPSSERHFQIYRALQQGIDIDTICRLTHLKPWFIEQVRDLVRVKGEISAHRGQPLPEGLLIQAKLDGFSDACLARKLGCEVAHIRQRCLAFADTQISTPLPVKHRHSTLEEKEPSPRASALPPNHRPQILVLGPGSHYIGQGQEFDHNCIHAVRALRQAGQNVVLYNGNPDSVTADWELSDSLYLEPPTIEDIARVYEKESAQGIVVQFGGQRMVEMASALSNNGMRVLGTDPKTVVLARNHSRFRQLMRKLGIAQPDFELAETQADIFSSAAKIGYPVAVRPTSAMGGPSTRIAMDPSMLASHYDAHDRAPLEAPVVVEQFLEYAIEAETDALSDGREIFIPAVMEHIELAGVHSADSAWVIPPYSTSLRHVDTICEYARKIALELKVRGLFNVGFAIYNDTVYVLEFKPWASRSLPLLSKICDTPMAQLAAQIILGQSLAELGLRKKSLPCFGIKEAVFPFGVFPEVDPLLGPKMRSTGSVMALADSFGMAYFKSQQEILLPLPTEGTVLITVTDADKPSILEPARLFKEMGFSIKATKGTQEFMEKHGILADVVRKLGFGRPDLVDAIKTREVDLVINTPSGRQSQVDDSDIRKAAIQYRVPHITTPAGALAAAKGISARRRGQLTLWALQDLNWCHASP